MKSLQPALKNLLLFLIALAVVLFASAGTLRFVAGWVYLALLGALSLAITIYLAIYDEALLQRRLKAGPAAEQQTSQKLIQIAASLLLFAVLVIAGLDHRFHWSAMSRSAIVTADIVFALSFLLILVVLPRQYVHIRRDRGRRRPAGDLHRPLRDRSAPDVHRRHAVPARDAGCPGVVVGLDPGGALMRSGCRAAAR